MAYVRSTGRAPLYLAESAGAAAGDVLAWNPDTGRAEWVPAPTGGGTGGGGAPTGGASGDLRWSVPAGALSIDEFNDGALDAAWRRVDPAGAAGSIAWTEGGDTLSCSQLGGAGAAQNTIHGLVRPLSGAGGALAVGDAFVTCVTHHGPLTNFLMAGIVLSDGTAAGAGAQVAGLCYATTTPDTVTYNAWAGSSWALSSMTTDTIGRAGTTFLRLALIAPNTWRVDGSPNGVAWQTGLATLTQPIAPTHVGLVGSQWGTVTRGVMSYEFLRRVSGVS